jgi:hypothetical protein
MIPYVRTDGGRSLYFKGNAGDCVVRAIALAADLDYKDVYDRLKVKMGKGKSPRNGVPRAIYHDFIIGLGFKWIPYTGIGTGCRVHLNQNELPTGTMICRLSKHLCCVKDHTIYDTFHPGDGRCVYGVYLKISK